MTRYPLQRWGLGDIIFCQALAKYWIDNGDTVIWGVEPHFLEGLIRAYPQCIFLDKRILNIDYECKTHKPFADGIIEPIRWSDSIMNVPYSQVMSSKYSMYGIDFRTWRDVMYERSQMREVTLREIMFSKIHEQCKQLGLTEYTYNLISPYYGSGSQFKANIEPDNGLPNIYMSSIPGYSLFDWSLLLEHATEIHAVSSSIIYLLELLNFTGKAHLYPREKIEPKTWYENISYLLTKNYVIH